jgi:hypothetical protein
MYNPYIYLRRRSMSENMVRTQVYLPRAIYKRLQVRAKKNDLTLAVQIREALEDYLIVKTSDDEERPMSPDDPLLELIGSISTGLGDGSINHDKYIYRRDWGPEPEEYIGANEIKAVAVKESRPKYQAKKPIKKRRAK